MSNPVSQRRYCSRCFKPERACICAFINVVDNPIDVLILQHPDEIHHPKNSAGLLHLCLKNSRLLQGSEFDESSLQAALFEGNKQPILLYPDLEKDTELSATETFSSSEKLDPSRLRLVVLDATWRKSRTLLLQHPQLQALVRLALNASYTSQYRIRHAHQAHQLSTLEATTYALIELHKLHCNPILDHEYSNLLDSFAQLNEQQIGFGVLNKLR